MNLLNAVLTQTPKPIRIFTGEAEPAPFDWTPFLWAIGAVLVLGALTAVVAAVARRRLNSRPPDEVAFAVLARRMKLSRGERTLLRELALKAGLASPVAAMISRGAFDRLLAAGIGRGASVESVKRIRGLGERLRWVAEREIDIKPEPEAQPVKRPAGPTRPKAAPGRAPSVAGRPGGGPGKR